MSELRIRLKFGDREFEAQGDHEKVQAEAATFRKVCGVEAKPVDDAAQAAADIRKAVRLSGRFVCLATHRKSVDDSILTILLGQKHLRNNNSVSGVEIMNGLRATHQDLYRVDQRINGLISDGSINVKGRRRARRYTLTNRGVLRAQAVAKEMAAVVVPAPTTD